MEQMLYAMSSWKSLSLAFEKLFSESDMTLKEFKPSCKLEFVKYSKI